MDLTSIIIAVFSGGAATKIFDFFIAKERVNQDEFQAIVEQWQSDNERLRDENENYRKVEKDLYKKLSSLEKQIQNLQTKLLLMESAHQHLPIPSWLKDTDGKMLSVNKAYETNFLIPNGFTKFDYMGKTDVEIWGEKIASEYKETDENALKCDQKYWFGHQPIIVGKSDETTKWKVLKYVRYVNDVAIGIGGIAIPLKK